MSNEPTEPGRPEPSQAVVPYAAPQPPAKRKPGRSKGATISVTTAEASIAARALGLTLFRPTRAGKFKGDIGALGKMLGATGAVDLGRGLYLLSAEHLVRALSAVSNSIQTFADQPNFIPTPEYREWLALYVDLVKTAKDAGTNVIKSEAALNEANDRGNRPPSQSFTPGMDIPAPPGQVVVLKDLSG